MCGLVCPSRTSEREGKGYCVKGGWREGEERVKERVRRSVNPITNPDPNYYCSTNAYYKACVCLLLQYLLQGSSRGGVTVVVESCSRVCLLLQYLLQSCSRAGGGGNSGGHALRETTSRGLCGLVYPNVCVC